MKLQYNLTFLLILINLFCGYASDVNVSIGDEYAYISDEYASISDINAYISDDYASISDVNASISDVNASTLNKEQLIKEIIDKIENTVRNHYLLNHDFLKCFADGKYKNMTYALVTFVENHYSYSKNFRDFLINITHKLDISIKNMLTENIDEEEGNYHENDIITIENLGFLRECFDKIPHRILIKLLLNKLEVNESLLNDPLQPGYKFTDFMFNKYKNSTGCQDLAIIGYAIESTISTLYTHIYNGINYTNISKCDSVFFPLHIFIDDGHADVIKSTFKKMLQDNIKNNKNECENANEIIKEVLDKRSEMYDEIRNILIDENIDECDLPQKNNIQAAEIKKAILLTKNMFSNNLTQKQKIAIAGRVLAEEGHGKGLSGQITCRDLENKNNVYMYTNTYGQAFETTKVSNLLRVDENLNVVDDDLNIIDENSTNYKTMNRATRFHMYVYKHNSNINCIIHTHPFYSSALSMMGEELVINHMDVMGLYNRTKYIPEWPGVPFGNVADDEGKWILSAIEEGKTALLLGHHGLTVSADTIERATYLAYFFELAAKLQIISNSATNGRKLPNVNVTEAIIARDWRLQDGPVNAHFYSWVDQALIKGHKNAFD